LYGRSFPEFAEIIAIPKQEAPIAAVLFEGWIYIHGVPSQIILFYYLMLFTIQDILFVFCLHNFP